MKKTPVIIPLRFKIMGGFIATLFLFCIFIFLFFPFIERKRLNHFVKTNYFNRGTMMALELAESTRLKDANLVQQSINFSKRDSEIVFIAVKDPTGKLSHLYNPEKIKNIEALLSHTKLGFFEIGGKHYYGETFPIKSGNIDYGTLQIAGSLRHYYQQIHKSTLFSLYISLFIFFIGFIISFIFSKKVTNPLKHLQKATEKIRKGDFDHTISVESKDEVGVLAYSFNEMADTMRMLISDLNKEIETTAKSEKALHEGEIQFRTLINTIPEAVWMKDKKGRFIWCNTEFENMNGIKEADIKGKTDFELTESELAEFFAQTEEQVLKTGKPFQFENQSFSPRYGKMVTMETIKTPMLNSKGDVIGILGIARDITKLKRFEEELSRERTMLRTIIDLIPESIYVKDTKGRKILANPKEVEFLGKKSEEEVLGKTDFDMYPKEEAMNFLKEDQEVLQSGKSILDLESKFADGNGNPHWFLGIKVPLFDANKKIIGLVGMNHDITERKLAQAEIEEQNEELTKINAEKDKFFSIIAHDLRGPFSNFMGLTEMMVEELRDMTQEQLHEMAMAMNTSASKLYGLLENLLQWSRSQRNTITFEPKLLKLSNLVDKSIKPLIDSATKKELTIEKLIPGNVQVFADSNMMETVIRNLFSNALKFTPRQGKVSITASPKNTKWVDITIKDTGIGMDNTLLANLFTLSSQTGRKGTEGEPSSGLGLLLCKEFVEKNHGTLWVESKENEGSTFIFTVPTIQNGHKHETES